MFRIGKSEETNILVVAEGQERKAGQEKGGLIAKRYRIYFGGDENVPKLTVFDGCTYL